MTAMMFYGISILFSPGPVTLVATGKGLKKQFRASLGYFLSIGTATYLLLLIYGYTGQQMIKKEYLSTIGILGCVYMFWLSYRMFRHSISLDDDGTAQNIGFKEGFLMQFLNPKASLATLPIATIQYPMNGIEGSEIIGFSLIFFTMGVLSPALYCLAGQYLTRFIGQDKWLNRFNKGMAVMLSCVAAAILVESIHL